MSDIDDFLDLIGELIDKLPNGEEIVDNIQDSIQSIWDKLNDSNIELDDEHKELLINKLAETWGESPDVVAKNWDVITSNAPEFVDNTKDKVTDVDISDSFKQWKGEFTDGCWDVCVASIGEGSKRMTCGYYT